jgi:hypothetical protein
MMADAAMTIRALSLVSLSCLFSDIDNFLKYCWFCRKIFFSDFSEAVKLQVVEK